MPTAKTKIRSVRAAARPMPSKKRHAATNRTAAQLMAEPEPMLAWLKSFTPRSIVTRDTLSNESCLFANFLKAHSHASEISATLDSLPPWFADALNALPTSTPITARRAIAQIHKSVAAVKAET